MRTPRVGQRHATLRWFVPAGVLCVAVAAVGVAAVRGGSDRLAGITPEILMSAMRSTGSDGYSGTLVAQMSLELPAATGGSRSRTPILVMSGAHTMRYWYGGSDRQRVALLDANSESDVFCIGANLWQWNSATNLAIRSTLPGTASDAIGSPVFPAPLTYAALTPEQLAARALAAVGGDTATSVGEGPKIAGHRTYQLSLRPARQEATRIAAVRIDVDAVRSVPLGVQVYARGRQQPSIDVSFSNISYRMPAAEYFEFTPPPGSTVRRGVQPQLVAAHRGAQLNNDRAVATEPAAKDTGWAAITAFRLTDSGTLGDASSGGAGDQLRSAMRAVSGPWGSGYLLDTPLLCVLVTSDGRVLSGSVEPAALYAAAG